MLNAEKYRDKLLKFIEEGDAGSFTFSKGEEGKFWQCGGRRCSECGMTKEGSNCSLARIKWLLSEYKEPIKLSRLEYEILKYLQKKKNAYISRSKNGELVVHRIKPISKENAYWKGMDISYCLKTFEDDLFHFVKWEDEEPTLIKEVLNNCEVVEDD